MLEVVNQLPAGTIKRLHVNQHIIRSNGKTGSRVAPLTAKTSHGNSKGSRIEILDQLGNVIASVIYQPDDPLSCGAKVWITTHAEIRVWDDISS
jgi:hypothetical protein